MYCSFHVREGTRLAVPLRSHESITARVAAAADQVDDARVYEALTSASTRKLVASLVGAWAGRRDDARIATREVDCRLLTLDDTVEFFNLILGTQLTPPGKEGPRRLRACPLTVGSRAARAQSVPPH
jgi:hypothetical protein